MRAVTELDGGLWAAECMGWVGVFFNPTRLFEEFSTQLNPTHYIYRNQRSPTYKWVVHL